jgi:hypothetical protein
MRLDAVMRLDFKKLSETGPDLAKTGQHRAIIQEFETKNAGAAKGGALQHARDEGSALKSEEVSCAFDSIGQRNDPRRPRVVRRKDHQADGAARGRIRCTPICRGRPAQRAARSQRATSGGPRRCRRIAFVGDGIGREQGYAVETLAPWPKAVSSADPRKASQRLDRSRP